MDTRREVIAAGEEATLDFGRKLGAELRGGATVALCGELGAGKTCLVRGLAAGLGYGGGVTSPTFTLVHEYRGGRVPLFHADLYRLKSEAEAMELGLEEIFDLGGVTAVEWADRFPGLMPPYTLWITMENAGGPDRRIRVSARA